MGKSQRRNPDPESEDDHPAKRGSSTSSLARKSKLKAYIIGLNTQFASWVSTQSNDELWTAGIKDYLSHVDSLLSDFKDVVPSAASQTKQDAKSLFVFPPAAAPPSSTTEPASFSFGAQASTGAAAVSKVTFSLGGNNGGATSDEDKTGGALKKTPSFGFSAPSTTTAQPATAAPSSFTFGGASSSAEAPLAPLFAFGGSASSAAATSTTASIPLFSFAPNNGSDASASTLAAPAAFSFGSTSASAPAAFSFAAPPTSFGAPPAVGNDEGEGEEEPQKFVSEVAVNDDAGTISFRAKSKFRHLNQASKTWDEKGVGTLMLRVRIDGSKKKPFVSFTTEAGRVLYIANLSKDMKVLVFDGRDDVTFAAPWSPDGQSVPSLQSVMFKLGKGKNREFKAEVEKLQAAMA